MEETKFILEKISSLKELGIINGNLKNEKRNTDYLAIADIVDVLKSDWIGNVSGYFNNHRASSDYTILDTEYKIQDLIFMQLNSIIQDLHYENPQEKTKGGLSHTRIDFSSKFMSLGIEVKHASNKHKAKKIEAEIGEDIIKYGKANAFKTIIFYIYCYNYNFPNKTEFEKGLTHEVTINKFAFNTICIII